MVIDCDLHPGNGTARIVQQDRTVFTFSIRQRDLYSVSDFTEMRSMTHCPDWPFAAPRPRA